MNASAARRERVAAIGLLLLCGFSCLCLADATSALERANLRRSGLTHLLAEQLALPDQQADGPIAMLDGLFARGLQRVTNASGTTIAFVDAAPGDDP